MQIYKLCPILKIHISDFVPFLNFYIADFVPFLMFWIRMVKQDPLPARYVGSARNEHTAQGGVMFTCINVGV